MSDYLHRVVRGASSQGDERTRASVQRRLDMFLRGEIEGFALERTSSGKVFIKVYPRVIAEPA